MCVAHLDRTINKSEQTITCMVNSGSRPKCENLVFITKILWFTTETMMLRRAWRWKFEFDTLLRTRTQTQEKILYQAKACKCLHRFEGF